MVWWLAACGAPDAPEAPDPSHGAQDPTGGSSSPASTGGSTSTSDPSPDTGGCVPTRWISGPDASGASFDPSFGSIRASFTLLADGGGTLVSLCDPAEGELHSTLDITLSAPEWDGDLADTDAYCMQRFVLDDRTLSAGSPLWATLEAPSSIGAAYDSCWGNLGTSQTGTTGGLSLLAAFGGLQLGVGALDPDVAAAVAAGGGDPETLVGGWFYPRPAYVEVDPKWVSGAAYQLDAAGAAILRDGDGQPVPWDPADVPTAAGVQPGRYDLSWLGEWRVQWSY